MVVRLNAQARNAFLVAVGLAAAGAAACVAYVHATWDANRQGEPVGLVLAGAVGGSAGLLLGAALVLDDPKGAAGKKSRVPRVAFAMGLTAVVAVGAWVSGVLL